MDALRNDGKPATAHCLRHWNASTLYQLTHDIVLVKELLGHESVATTQIYAGADMSKSAEWVGKL
jgi:site-specific recombinase XerC